MKQNKRLLFFSSILLAFATYVYAPVVAVGEDFKFYYSQFMVLYNRHCSYRKLPNKIVIKYKKLPSGIIGLCTSSAVSATISIDPEYWEMANENFKKQLMYHELGHCFLDLDHVEDKNHYMNAYVSEISNDELMRQVREDFRNKCGE
jgi:hypothetical protein